MRDEGRFHLDGGDPDPADLEHVVAASGVPVEAVGVAAVLVSGAEPLARERSLRGLVLVPVEGHDRVAAHEQVADLLAAPSPRPLSSTMRAA